MSLSSNNLLSSLGVILSWRDIVPLTRRRIITCVFETSEDFVLLEIFIQRFLGDISDYLTEKKEAEVGV